MYSWKDKLRDWANQKGAWTHILVAVAIALIITAIILGAAMPSRGAVSTNAANITDIRGDVANNTDDIITIAGVMDSKADQEELDSWGRYVSDAVVNQTIVIRGLNIRVGNAETGINEAMSNITAMQSDLAEMMNSPLTASLNGTFGNYTLSVKSGEAGNFTANVHLIYSRAFGCNGTYEECQQYFYSGINWTKATPYYCTVVTFNGTAWGISEVWWNIGAFELVAGNATAIPITCADLNSTWEPSFVYVEVWPILKT